MRPWFKFVADLIAEEPENAAEIIRREMQQIPPGLLHPDTEGARDDPFAYRVTFGLYEGWWVDAHNPEVVLYHSRDFNEFGVHVVLRQDMEAFEKENPDWTWEDEWSREDE